MAFNLSLATASLDLTSNSGGLLADLTAIQARLAQAIASMRNFAATAQAALGKSFALRIPVLLTPPTAGQVRGIAPAFPPLNVPLNVNTSQVTPQLRAATSVFAQFSRSATSAAASTRSLGGGTGFLGSGFGFIGRAASAATGALRGFANIATGGVSLGLRSMNSGLGVTSRGFTAIRSAAALAGAAITGTFLVGAHSAADFESRMARVATLMTGADVAWIPTFSTAVRKLSVDTGVSASTLADALFDIISAGTPAGGAIDTLTAAAQGARAGFTDTATVVKGLTGVLAAYRISTTEAKTVTDKLFEAAQLGRLDLSGIAANIGQIAPLAHQAGVSLDSLLAAFSAISQVSTPNETATQLVNILKAFLRPQQQASEAAAQLGIELNAAALQGDNLLTTLDALSHVSAEDLFKVIGDQQAAQGIAALTANLRFFKSSLESIKGAQGVTLEALGKVVQTTAFRFDVLRQRIAEMSRQFQAIFTPTLNTFIDALGGIVTATTAWISANRGLVARVGEITAAMIAFGAATVAAGTALGIIASPLFLAGSVIGIMVAALVDANVAGDTFGEKMSNLAGILTRWASVVGTTVADVLRRVGPYLLLLADGFSGVVAFVRARVIPGIIAAGAAIARGISSAFDLLAPVFVALVSAVQAVFTALVDIIGPAAKAIFDAITGAFSSLLPSLSTLQDFRDLVVAALFQVTFAARNWQTLMTGSILSVSLAAVSFAEDVKFLFTTQIPEFLLFLLDNWRDIFNAIAKLTLDVLKNAASNIGAFFKGVFESMKSGFLNPPKFDFAPLVSGFQLSLKSLPQIASRAATDTEKAFQAAIEANGRLLAKAKDDLANTFLAPLASLPGFVFNVPELKVPPVPAQELKLPDTSKFAGDIGSQIGASAKASFLGLEEAFKHIQVAAASSSAEQRQVKAAEDTAKNTNGVVGAINQVRDAINSKLGNVIATAVFG